MTGPLARRGLLALPLLAAAGCSLLPDRPYLDRERFVLAPQRPGPPVRTGRRRTVLVRTLRGAPAMDRRGLRSVFADGTESIDFYAEWAAAPLDAAEQALRTWLGASGRFSAVLAPGTRADPELVMETELTELAAFVDEGEARATLSVVLLDGRGRVLRQAVPTGRAPLPDRSRTQRAETRAAAMSEALGAAFVALEAALPR